MNYVIVNFYSEMGLSNTFPVTLTECLQYTVTEATIFFPAVYIFINNKSEKIYQQVFSAPNGFAVDLCSEELSPGMEKNGEPVNRRNLTIKGWKG